MESGFEIVCLNNYYAQATPLNDFNAKQSCRSFAYSFNMI